MKVSPNPVRPLVNQSFTAVSPGTDEGQLVNGQLQVGAGPIIINGTPITSNPGAIIPGIQNIFISPDGGSYTLYVVGACPEGSFDNEMVFTDATGSSYTLRIYSDTVKTHSVNYISNDPTIVQITWDI